MRNLLILLCTLITVGAIAQTNPNSAVYAYQTMAQAIKSPKDTNWKITVFEPKIGGNFMVKMRSQGYTPDGGTVIAMSDSLRVLVRDISQSHGIKLNWFLKGDNVTDNAAKMNWLVSAASPFNHFIIEQGDKFFCSQNITPGKPITIEGPDGYEVPLNTAYFTFPQGVNGFVFNNINSAGSLLKGFAILSTLPESGRILEYNPNNGTMLYFAPITPLTAGKTFEFKDAYFPDKTRGTAVISNAGTANIVWAIEYTQPTGTFQIGETITGATSGAKATVRFVSRIFNAVAVGATTGTFKANETITGSTSGATAKFYAIPNPARWQYAKVANISNATGSLDNPGGAIVDTSLHNADTLQYNVTGSLDSLGASGKRTNIFVEANKYSVGIVVNRRITLEDVTVTGFGGDGIYITSATTPVSNANLTRLLRVRSNANAGNGIRIYSGDANHISLESSTIVNNTAWGVCDMSFLGVSLSHTHLSVNMTGGYTSGTYINRKTVYDNPYTEGAYNSMLPWQSAENIMGGGAVKIGGTDGLVNNTPDNSTSGNSGAEYSNSIIKNNMIYTDLSNIHDPKIIFKSTGGITHNIIIQNQGAPSVGRGGTLGFQSPYGAGNQGADIKNTALDMGNILGSQATGSTYGFDFFLRRNVPPAMTITGGSGTGAVLQPDILNGKVIKVNVLAGGKSYPINGTTVTSPNFPNTTFVPYVEDSVIKAVLILGDSLTSNGDNDIYSVAQVLSNGTIRPTTNATGSLGDATHHWKVAYVDSIVSAGAASTQYIWNQNATQQPADFRIGTTGSTISNHSAVIATPNANIINPGLNVIARSGADGYYSPFHIYQNGANSGMHFSTWGSNNSSITGGGYYRTLANGMLGGYYFLDNQISNITFSNGTIHYLLGNNTAGNIAPLTDVGYIDTTGTHYILPKASATNGLVIRTVVGANTNEFRCCGVDGRTFGAYQNGVLNNLNIVAQSTFFSSNFILDKNKSFQMYDVAGTNQGYFQILPTASKTLAFYTKAAPAMQLDTIGRMILSGPVNPKAYTVATLPIPWNGDIAMVTDASNPVSGAVVAGGGTTQVPVFRNSNNQWIVMGAGGGSGGGTTLNGTGYVKQSGATTSYVSAIPNTDLANSSITINGSNVALGGSVNVNSQRASVNVVGTTQGLITGFDVYQMNAGAASTFNLGSFTGNAEREVTITNIMTGFNVTVTGVDPSFTTATSIAPFHSITYKAMQGSWKPISQY